MRLFPLSDTHCILDWRGPTLSIRGQEASPYIAQRDNLQRKGKAMQCNASDGWSSERSGSVVGAVSPLRLTWQRHATAFPISQWSRATLKNASRRAARTGKVGSVRMRERSSFGRAQRGEGGRLRHFGKVAQTARSVGAQKAILLRELARY